MTRKKLPSGQRLIFVAGLFFSVFVACETGHEREHGDGRREVSADSSLSQYHDDQHSQSSPVLLNNGVRWQANPETTEGIARMNTLLDEFPASPDLSDYHSLKINMEAEFNLVIERCTMTGEAHTQLHNYLIPLGDILKDLDSSDPAICRDALKKLRQHLGEYGNYFI